MSNTEGNLFAPFDAVSVNVSASSTVAQGAIGVHPMAGGGTIWVCNAGPNTAWIKLGPAGQSDVTLTTGLAIPSGMARPFGIGKGAAEVSCICDTAETAELSFMHGAGL